MQNGTQDADGWWRRNAGAFLGALRAVFGLIWVVDGAMKFVFVAPSDLSGMLGEAGAGQPTWLAPWFTFWTSAVNANPALFLYGTGVLEITLGVCLIVGLMRKTAYLGSVGLGLMIWSVVEGFGGPYGPGSTDLGSALMYAVLGFALLVAETASATNAFSLDALIERRFAAWQKLAELGRAVRTG